MRVLAGIFNTIWIVAVVANGFLFLYVEWLHIRESFLNLIFPWVHFQVVLTLLTLPAFWMIASVLLASFMLARAVEARIAND